jgi:hypothetical protein
MNKRIIYPTDNSGVSVIIPAPDARKQVLVFEAVTDTIKHDAVINQNGDEIEPARDEIVIITPAVYRDETDEEFAAWVAAKDVPAGKPFQIVDVTDIPTDRTFRNAWEYAE